jgi:hypothetical protein
MQRESAAKAPLPTDDRPAQRPWEALTEAEQFAILYPERAAAGATSHEDADLWLPRFSNQTPTNPAQAKARRATEVLAT